MFLKGIEDLRLEKSLTGRQHGKNGKSKTWPTYLSQAVDKENKTITVSKGVLNCRAGWKRKSVYKSLFPGRKCRNCDIKITAVFSMDELQQRY